MWSDLPTEIWAIAGILMTGTIAYIRERAKATASPYEAMAERLLQVEKRAEKVPFLSTSLAMLMDWADDASGWMRNIEKEWHEQTGTRFHTPPPLPPPRLDRRWSDWSSLS